MNIRKATSADAKRISYLIVRNTEKVLENNYNAEQIRVWKKYNSPKAIKEQLVKRVILCACVKEKLVGTIALQESEVAGLYVSFTKRGKGVGRQLLDYLEDYAKSCGIKELSLTSTPSAESFYRRNGYQPVGDIVIYEEGVAFKETRMIKDLQTA